MGKKGRNRKPEHATTLPTNEAVSEIKDSHTEDQVSNPEVIVEKEESLDQGLGSKLYIQESSNLECTEEAQPQPSSGGWGSWLSSIATYGKRVGV